MGTQSRNSRVEEIECAIALIQSTKNRFHSKLESIEGNLKENSEKIESCFEEIGDNSKMIMIQLAKMSNISEGLDKNKPESSKSTPLGSEFNQQTPAEIEMRSKSTPENRNLMASDGEFHQMYNPRISESQFFWQSRRENLKFQYLKDPIPIIGF